MRSARVRVSVMAQLNAMEAFVCVENKVHDNVEEDAAGSSDHHRQRLNLIVVSDDSQNSEIDEHGSNNPDDQGAEQSTQYLAAVVTIGHACRGIFKLRNKTTSHDKKPLETDI